MCAIIILGVLISRKSRFRLPNSFFASFKKAEDQHNYSSDSLGSYEKNDTIFGDFRPVCSMYYVRSSALQR